MALVIASRSTPEALTAVEFWDYLIGLGYSQQGVADFVDGMVADGDMTATDAARLKLRIWSANTYERTSAQVATMASAMGLASTQAEIDAHFRSAKSQ